MRHTRSKRACRAGCCARDLCDSETLLLTREFPAQIIGVRRNAVSIVAHALQQAGIVCSSRGHIEIGNANGSRETARKCYDTIKAHHQRLLSMSR